LVGSVKAEVDDARESNADEGEAEPHFPFGIFPDGRQSFFHLFLLSELTMP